MDWKKTSEELPPWEISQQIHVLMHFKHGLVRVGRYDHLVDKDESPWGFINDDGFMIKIHDKRLHPTHWCKIEYPKK